MYRCGRRDRRRRAVCRDGAQCSRRRRCVRERVYLWRASGMAAGESGARGQRIGRNRRHATRMRELHADLAGSGGFHRRAGRMAVTNPSPDGRAGDRRVPDRAADIARWSGRTRSAVHRRRVRDFRTRQRRRNRRSAAERARPAALLRAPQRTGHGAHGRGVRENAQSPSDIRVHDLHRPRRDEHGHGGSGRHDQSIAGAAAARRYLRHQKGGAGAAAAGGRMVQDQSVNDCFKPVSKFWDRINRAEQLAPSLMEAMRVLTSPADTGAVTLALPQDVQAEACDFPTALFEPRTWYIARPRADAAARRRSADDCCASAQAPLIIAGGGVIYSERDRSAAAIRRANGNRGRRDPGRQGHAAVRPSSSRSARSA